jgi:hypothetical protein
MTGITATVTIITSKMALISKERGLRTLNLAQGMKSGQTKQHIPDNITVERSRVRGLSDGPMAPSMMVISKITIYTDKAHINGAMAEATTADGT